MATISEEDKKLLDAFKALHVKPKADSPEDLEKWLKEYSSVGAKAPASGAPPITVSSHQPRLSIFYGDTTTLNKGEATYDQWRYEVTSLMYEKTYKQEALLQAIRRSVKGEAGRILMRLGPGSDIRVILEKFDSVYGVVDSKETLLANFYSARQKQDEDVTSWSCRLEDILNVAVERHHVSTMDANDMLKSMFWTGMKQELKDVSGYKYETVKDFDKLRVELRKLEQEHALTAENKCKPATSKSAVDKETSTLREEIKELRGIVASLATTVTDMDKRLQERKSDSPVYDEDTHIHRGQERRSNVHYEDRRQHTAAYEDRRQSSRTNDMHRRAGPYRDQRSAQYRDSRQDSSYRNQRPTQYHSRQDTSYRDEPTRQNSDHKYDEASRDRPPRQYDRQYGQPSRDHRYSQSIEVEDIDPNARQGPLCFRCRQRGHFQWECTARLDHMKHLN